MSTLALNTFVIEPLNTANMSVIWMHGLGASAHDFEDIVPQLTLKPNRNIRFVFPSAPVQPVTINAGMAMPSWYDVYHLGRIDKQDQAGMELSAAAISLLIDQEIEKGITSDHIVLAGFSQGGVMSLHTGLRYPEKLGGILALSCYVPLSDFIQTERAAVNNNIPIFMAHGTHDMTIPMMIAEMGYAQLEKLGYPISWHGYPMEHQMCLEEIQDISAFLNGLPVRV
jgi:phospholipase/carboxylesterase